MLALTKQHERINNHDNGLGNHTADELHFVFPVDLPHDIQCRIFSVGSISDDDDDDDDDDGDDDDDETMSNTSSDHVNEPLLFVGPRRSQHVD